MPCCVGCGKKFKHLSGGGNPLLTEPVLCTRVSAYIFSLSSHKATPILQMDTTSHAARMWHDWNSFQAHLATKGIVVGSFIAGIKQKGRHWDAKSNLTQIQFFFFHFTWNYLSINFKLSAFHSCLLPFLWPKSSTSFQFLQRPTSSSSKESACQCRRQGSSPGPRRSYMPWSK